MELLQPELSNQRDGYALFQRAIVEADEDAWAALYERYRSLLVSWARHYTTMPLIGEYYDDIADQAFARAWAALSPARFHQFASVAKLLAYLRTCVVAVVIDHARARAARERMMQRLEAGALTTPEEVVLSEMERMDLWQFINGLAETEQERMILIENFVLELPPRTILGRHPELFGHISAVYFAKRNLLARLHRNQELQRLRRDFLSP